MVGEILRNIGNDPLSELMEMDNFYGWTRRINRLTDVYRERTSPLPYFLIGGLVAASMICGALVLYLIFLP